MSAVRTRQRWTEQRGTYLYGLVRADEVALPAGLEGVGGRAVEVSPLDGCAALVSADVDRDAFGLPGDLLAHTRTLDEVARSQTVVPVAFGTFVDGDPDAGSLGRTFTSVVDRVEGAVQLTLTVRYREDVVLGELVQEDRRIAALRRRTAGTPESLLRGERLRLGELVVQGLDRKAEADAERIVGALAPLTREIAVRGRRQADDVVELAALVDRDRAEAFEAVCDGVAAGFSGRARFRLIGPQAPYDFVGRT